MDFFQIQFRTSLNIDLFINDYLVRLKNSKRHKISIR